MGSRLLSARILSNGGLLLIALLTPVRAFAQAPTDDASTLYFGRISIQHTRSVGEADFWRAMEVRGGDVLMNQVRADATLGMGYQLTPWLHTAGYYTFIGKCDFHRELSHRHRLGLNLTASYKVGDWTFSEKETLMFTHRSGEMNTWQNPRNALALKSRVKVEWKANKNIRPFLAFEVRNTLNAPSLQGYVYDRSQHRYTTLSGDVYGEPGWMLDGFNDVYINRLRLQPGVKMRLDKRRSVSLYALLDYRYDKDIDISADGTRLKGLVNIPEYDLSLCLNFTRKL